MAITPTTPGAPDESWSTPARSPGPVVSPIVPTHEVVPGGQHIGFPGDADPGGRDIVSDSVAGSVAAAQARYHELMSDTFGLGSVVGDLLPTPEVSGVHSKHLGGDGAGYPS